MIIARKVRLTIVSDNSTESYRFLRDEMYYHYKALDFAMNHVYFNYIAKDKIKMADTKYVEREQRCLDLINKGKVALSEAKTDKQKKMQKRK